MSRKPRFALSGVPQHVIQRGNNRESCFFAEDGHRCSLLTATRRRAYRGLFGAHLAPEEVHAIRAALNQELVLGRKDFKDKIERMTQRQARPVKPGRPRTKETAEPVPGA